mgnify:CR=1 FL=1
MVLIEVKEEDIENVFEILITNVKFAQLSPTQFRIDENEDDTLKKIRDKGIVVTIIHSRG